MNPFHPNHTFSKKPPPARRSVQLKARLPGFRFRQVLWAAVSKRVTVDLVLPVCQNSWKISLPNACYELQVPFRGDRGEYQRNKKENPCQGLQPLTGWMKLNIPNHESCKPSIYPTQSAAPARAVTSEFRLPAGVLLLRQALPGKLLVHETCWYTKPVRFLKTWQV